MKIIDLTKEIYTNMEVYENDPEVKILETQKIEQNGWKVSKIEMGSHTGTHTDAFSHVKEKAESIDKIPLEKFLGKGILVKKNSEFPKKIGLVFEEFIDENLSEKIIKASPNFVAGNISEKLEKILLENQIVTYTDLENLEELPFEKEFLFIGLPLKLKDCDGSPVRAIAIIEE